MSVAGELKHYPQITASAEGLPQMLASNRDARPLPSSLRHASVANTNGSQNASGRLSFQIPAGRSSVIKPGSVHVVFDLIVSGLTDTNGVYFHNCGSGASMFRKVSLQVQNQVVELIDNYHILSALNMFHNMSASYVDNDRIIYGGTGEVTGTQGTAMIAGVAGGYSANTAGLTNVIVPLLLGAFNGEQGLPLYLVNSPLLVDVELNPIVDAIYSKLADNSGAGTAPSGYTISNAFLCYEEIALDQSFVNQVKSSMAAGQQFSMPVRQNTLIQTTNSAIQSQVFGVNYSSLNFVAFTNRAASTAGTRCLYTGTGLNKCNVYLDGRLLNNYPIDSIRKSYLELNKALGKPFDSSVASAPIRGSASFPTALGSNMTLDSPGTAGNYATTFYWGGVDTRRFHDVNLSMTGSPVQTLQLEIATFAQANVFVVMNYDSVLLIDANGAVQLLK
jgi:hypothetical protein